MIPSAKDLAAKGVLAGLLLAAWWLDRRPVAPVAADEPTLERHGFVLHEIAATAGLVFRHHPPRVDARLEPIRPHVAGIGAAVSVTDVDGDGWSDVYVVDSEFCRPNALFRNLGDGRFADVAPELGLADLNREGEGASMGSVWADFDNDGDEDVFVHKWGYPQLLRNDGGAFVDVTERAGLRRWMNSNAAVWLDYDRDGAIDLYVAGYFREDLDLARLASTRIMQESFEFADNGGHNYLFRNLGDGRFEDVTQSTGCDSTRWTLGVASADLDGDGWVDLYLANDYGPEELFLNREGRRFERATGVGLDESSKSGMSVTFGDLHGDGTLAVYVTNISKAGFLFQGNNLRLNQLARAGRLYNVAEGDVMDCGWSWGARFGDLDNDGDPDLFVLNGFVSADPEKSYWYRMTEIAGGVGDVFEDALNWPPMEDRSLSGYERSRVLLNRSQRGFVDVAHDVGARDLYDGRSLAMADLGNRGALDVLVANQDGPLLLYRSEVQPGRHWIQLELVGRKSNRSAIGAQVTLHFGASKQVQVVDGGSGFCSQNQRRLHFGLGSAEQVERAEVRWPSGCEQVLEGLAVDRLHRIEESCP